MVLEQPSSDFGRDHAAQYEGYVAAVKQAALGIEIAPSTEQISVPTPIAVPFAPPLPSVTPSSELRKQYGVLIGEEEEAPLAVTPAETATPFRAPLIIRDKAGTETTPPEEVGSEMTSASLVQRSVHRVSKLVHRARQTGYRAAAIYNTASMPSKLATGAIGGAAVLSALYATSKLGVPVAHAGVTDPQLHMNGVQAHATTTANFSTAINGKKLAPTVHANVATHASHPDKHPAATTTTVQNTLPKTTPDAHFSTAVNDKPLPADLAHNASHAAAHNVANHAARTHHTTHGQNPHHEKRHHSRAPKEFHFGSHTVTLQAGDNPWTVAQRALHIPRRLNLSSTQLQRIWHLDQSILHLNHITLQHARDLQIGTKLKVPNLLKAFTK